MSSYPGIPKYLVDHREFAPGLVAARQQQLPCRDILFIQIDGRYVEVISSTSRITRRRVQDTLRGALAENKKRLAQLDAERAEQQTRVAAFEKASRALLP